ncbi:aldo/keto reductase [Desulfofustis limnaeus]|uniref:Aldo/keto reductase n=1 Tax=Desulfofustis limnaeus TaxID=2740163 RepID=A0ABN6M4V7_9BACT|nr:aldo/keto reductase [Desulfofustis limnaeus]BDD87918.1 aldo/keto reductase [Desulfofustis limnaeus]
MHYRYLGTTGIQVSKLCMGTMTFGNEADEAESTAMFRRCRDAGINTFDCANVYSQGRAEEILGSLIAGCREELIIISKGWGQMGGDINARGASRRNLIASVEASLRRLRTSWIDLYFLHRFDPHTPLEETLSTLDDLVRQGKIRYIGASNFAAWQVALGLGVSALHDWSAFCCMQPMYNLVKRQAEVELLPLAQSARLGVLSYNPLGGGLLTGKYGMEIASSDNRLGRLATYARRYGDQWMLEAAVKYVDFARTNGYNPVSLAVAWVAAHPAVTAPIIGARTTKQLEDSLNALAIEMDPELYHRLATLTPTPPPATDRTDDLKP